MKAAHYVSCLPQVAVEIINAAKEEVKHVEVCVWRMSGWTDELFLALSRFTAPVLEVQTPS